MAFEKLNFKIRGVAPLLLHNGQLADPLNEYTKALKQVSSKRNKTDEDYADMARIEWYGGLYTKDGKVCIPGFVIEATLLHGARKRRLGKKVQAGLFVFEDSLLIFPDMHLSIDELWESGKSKLTCGVKIRGARIMRTRPYFEQWEIEFTVDYETSLLNEREIVDIVGIAGQQVGLCDWRPRFGRFEVVE